MGSCGSSAKNPAGQKGHIPKKITAAKNQNIEILKVVYIFGGKKILKFDTKAMKLEAVEKQPTVPIPERTQCEYLRGINKIATLGGNLNGKISKLGYLFDPTDFSKAVTLPEFPKPIRYTTLAYYENNLYSIGGDTEGSDPKENVIKDVYKLQIMPEVGKAWEKVCDLPMQRRAANVMVASGSIYVFGGYSGGGLRSTQIDVVDLKTKTAKAETYRLPLGVEGARQCWFGDDILLIGGKRLDEQNDANVLQVDFLKTAIMSLR